MPISDYSGKDGFEIGNWKSQIENELT